MTPAPPAILLGTQESDSSLCAQSPKAAPILPLRDDVPRELVFGDCRLAGLARGTTELLPEIANAGFELIAAMERQTVKRKLR